mmetsp:Transcript_126088/g.228874  ORF Transcript_126088/g.228874 Transcript_126088/m.228874 type:complete len:444 (-) Transcript_126088:42-1373(-)
MMCVRQFFFVLSMTSAVLGLEEVSNYTFTNYIHDFGRTYEHGGDEYLLRAAIFKLRVAEIQAHNAAGHSWRKGVNHLTDRTAEELSQLNGYKRWMRSTPQAGDAYVPASSFLQIASESSRGCSSHQQECTRGANTCCAGMICGAQGLCEKVEELPESFDEWSELPTAQDILVQGECGSCWAVAATAAIQLQAVRNTDGRFQEILSPQNVLSCTPNPFECGGKGMCDGATAELGLQWLESTGSKGGLYPMSYQKYTAKPTPDACPFAPAKSFLQANPSTSMKPGVSIRGWKKIEENSAHAMMQHLVAVGPVVASVVGDPSLQSYSSGVISECPSPVIDHAVLMMGYGKDQSSGLKFWKIRNSWGTKWGENGFFRLQRFYPEEEEPCEMDYDTAKGVACKDKPGPQGHYPASMKVCGKCGILSDSAYPIGTEVPEWLLDAASTPY